MKRMIILTILALAFAVSVPAQQTPTLVVWHKDGTTTRFSLDKNPRTVFDGGILTITAIGDTPAAYQLENVLRYTFEGLKASGIDNGQTMAQPVFSQDGDALTVRNLPDGTTVEVYAANGTLLEMHHAADGQPLAISVADRPKGVYLVKTSGQTLKILKQ